MTANLVSILLAIVLLGCHPKESTNESLDQPNGGVLKINVPENIYELTPGSLSNESEKFIAQQLFEPLFISNGNSFTPNKRIIKSFDSSRVDTLIIPFKKSVAFSNGAKVDSVSLRYWIQGFNESGSQILYSPQNHSLFVTNSNITSALTSFTEIDHYLFTMEESIPIGTGPFKLQSMNEDIVVRLSRNTNYHNNQPYLDAVEIRMIKTKDTEIEEFMNGSLDLVRLDPFDRLQFQSALSLEDHPNYTVHRLDEVTYCFGLAYGMDSLAAYQIGKVLNERPIVYSLSATPRQLLFPNLSKADLADAIPVSSDQSVFSQLSLEQLTDKGIRFSAHQESSSFLHLVEGKFDENGVPSFKQSTEQDKTPDYLVILNYWHALAVYQYYLKSDNALDKEMIDLKSLYFKKPTKLE